MADERDNEPPVSPPPKPGKGRVGESVGDSPAEIIFKRGRKNLPAEGQPPDIKPPRDKKAEK